MTPDGLDCRPPKPFHLDGVYPNVEDQIRDFFSRQLEQPEGPTMNDTPRYDRPTRIILRSYAADDKPRIERLLGLARQLQLPVQLAGPWSCTAFPKGEEAHPAIDVVFPEVLVHPRDVLIISEGHEYHDGNGEKRLFSPFLAEAENQLLWAAREDDQRLITGLIELLGLPAEASRADIAAAVETKSLDGAYAKQAHLERTRYEKCDDRVRNILGAVDGEETDEAARRFVEAQEKVHAELGKQLEKEKRETQNRIRVETARLNNEIANLKDHEDAGDCQIEKSDLRDAVSRLSREAEQVREILGAASGEVVVDAAKRVVKDVAATEKSISNWRARDLSLRQEISENQRKLLNLLGAGPVPCCWDTVVFSAERVMTEYTEWRSSVLTALNFPPETSIDQVVETIEEQTKQVSEWRSQLAAERMTAAENLRKLLTILRATTGEPDWQRCFDYAEARMKNAAQFESEVAEALGLPTDTVQGHVIKWAKSLVGQNKYQTEKLAEALGYKSDDYCELLQQVQRVIREHQTLLGERIESNAKIDRLRASLDVKLAKSRVEIDELRSVRDTLKERLETAITAERQTIAQRIDLALTGKAEVTHLDTMLRAVEHLAVSSKLLNLVADALDAPNEEKAFTNDDGSLNTALFDRIVGYYKRLYTAAGYSEPPQGGWEEILGIVAFKTTQTSIIPKHR